MSDPMDPSPNHPDELLAGYVDGTATEAQRRTVDAHLSGCARCREEVELATEARAALISLPELDAPGIAAAGIEGLREASPQIAASGTPEGAGEAAPVLPLREPRRRIAWAQLAAAAVLIFLVGALVAIPLVLSTRGGAKRSAGKAGLPVTPTVSPLPALIDQGARYSKASLDALAERLAAAQRTAGLAPAARSNAVSASPAPQFGGAVRDAAAARDALTCIVQGGGPTSGAVPVYLEQAEVSGIPAYVGGFRLGGTRLNLMLIAVTRDGCLPLYSVRQPL